MAEKIIFLNNIRSAHNVGAIFRTADGAGVKKIFLGGYSPAPLDRFGRIQPEIKKTSLGATETVAWEQVALGDECAALAVLRTEGFEVVVIEQTESSISLYDFDVPEKVVYVFGNEVAGVDTDIIALADRVVAIPMQGMKESLNVSTTVGIVAFTR